MQQREKILVRGVNWLGDAVMSTPALLRLREAKPSAQIALLTHAKLADLWRLHPAIDSTIQFQDGEGLLSVARKLRGEVFSTALIFPNSPRSGLEALLARIPVRIGLDRGWRSRLLTRRIRPLGNVVTMRKRSVTEIKQLTGPNPERFAPILIPPLSHHIHHYLHLASALGAKTEPIVPRIEVSSAEVLEIQNRFGVRDDGRPLFGLNAGAEYGAAKRWPRERFIATAIEVQQRTNCRWWVFGGRADEPLALGIAKEIQAANAGGPPDSVRCLAGQTTLRELCAALKACGLLLTNDTGPMHVAAAVGTSVVVPFGSTAPELTGPGLPGDRQHQLIKGTAACAPCFRRECPIDFRCMTSITTDVMVRALIQLSERSKLERCEK